MPVKPSEAEEEHFARIEFERRKKAAAERAAALAAEERSRLKALHHMRCPKCGMELAEIAFRQIRIDRCTSCSGVWLDAGELEAVTDEEGKDGKGGFLSSFTGLFSKGSEGG